MSFMYKLSPRKIAILISLSIIGYLIFRLFTPFITSILWALVLAIILYPCQKWLNQKITSKNLATLISVATTVILILVPLVFLLLQLSHDLTSLYNKIQKSPELDNLLAILKNETWATWLEQRFGVSVDQIRENVVQTITQVLNSGITYITGLISNSVVLAINFLLIIFTLFFLLRDGEQYIKYLKQFLPITTEEQTELEETIKHVINAILFGSGATAILQGILAGFMFYILSVPGVLVWTLIMIILSVMPMAGSAFVWLPAAIWLFLTGSSTKAIILVLWGIFVVGLSDNFLHPILVSKQTKLNTLVTFYSGLGGIVLFGAVGLFLGPLIVACFLTLLSFIYQPDQETQVVEETEKIEKIEKIATIKTKAAS